jgi:hypothetical protein
MKSYCSTLGFFFFFAFEARNRLGLEQLSPFSSSDVEIERTFTVALEMLLECVCLSRFFFFLVRSYG